jgi:hypothetical protein
MNASEMMASGRIRTLLETWLGQSVEVRAEFAGAADSPDLLAHFDGLNLAVEVKHGDDIGLLDRSLRQLEEYARSLPGAVFVVAVPYMGPKARDYMRSRDASWLDLSGNADIQGPGLRILIEGRPNQFASPGRPSTAFSPKASRLTRAMLVEPERWWLQKELAEATGLSNGYVSKVIARLSEDDQVERRDDDGRVRANSPRVLLDAWSQAYDFRKHKIVRLHAVGRTGEAVLRAVTEKLDQYRGLRWAATGLAAAWQWTRFADFRLVTLFASQPLFETDRLGLRQVDEGENVWLVVPQDEGVFYAAEQVEGVMCVHPVQAYVDLLAHPERAQEAARHLRSTRLG